MSKLHKKQMKSNKINNEKEIERNFDMIVKLHQ